MAAAAEAAAAASTLLSDDRFKAMFEDTDFAIDEASHEYKLLHPNVAAAGGSTSRLLLGQERMRKEKRRVVVVEEQTRCSRSTSRDPGRRGCQRRRTGQRVTCLMGRMTATGRVTAGGSSSSSSRRVKGHWQQLKRQQLDTGQAKPSKR